MRFEDERYVRLYVRDTTAWVLAPWEARCVLPLVMRKLDRAGILELGKKGIAGLAAVIGIPVDITERGVSYWLDEGAFVLNEDGALVMPKFTTAQEISKSASERKREQRERDKEAKLASRPVTSGHVGSRDVTDVTPVRDASRNVTPCCAVPNHSVPIPGGDGRDVASGPMDPARPATPIETSTGEYYFGEEYSESVAARLGGFVLERNEQATVRKAINGFAPPGLFLEEVSARLRYSVGQYLDDREGNAKYEAGFQPRSWLKWLNSGNGHTLARAADVVSGLHKVSPMAPEPEETPEQRQASIDACAAYLRASKAAS